MSMQTANPLQQHIDRAQIGDQQVGVDVQRLFQRLRAHNDKSAGGAAFAQQHLNASCPVARGRRPRICRDAA